MGVLYDSELVLQCCEFISYRLGSVDMDILCNNLSLNNVNISSRHWTVFLEVCCITVNWYFCGHIFYKLGSVVMGVLYDSELVLQCCEFISYRLGSVVMGILCNNLYLNNVNVSSRHWTVLLEVCCITVN